MDDFDPYLELMGGVLEALENARTMEDVRVFQEEVRRALASRHVVIAREQMSYLQQSWPEGIH